MKNKPVKISGKLQDPWETAKRLGLTRKEFLNIKKVVDKCLK